MRKLSENKRTMILSGLAEGSSIKAIATPQPTVGRTRGPLETHASFADVLACLKAASLRKTVSRNARQEPLFCKKTVAHFPSLSGGCIMCKTPG
ncbi:MAG: hypothetical protein IID38_04065 [Planctomycetes bacterium]|nr:hypothetical protein [Planctomycetota bacterium]